MFTSKTKKKKTKNAETPKTKKKKNAKIPKIEKKKTKNAEIPQTMAKRRGIEKSQREKRPIDFPLYFTKRYFFGILLLFPLSV